MRIDKDYVGMAVSSLCLVHCLLSPVILALGYTSLSFAFLLDEKIHLALVVPIILLAVWSIPRGYGIHQKLLPLVSAIIGVILLIMGVLFHDSEIILTFLASSSLIIAHLRNKNALNDFQNNTHEFNTTTEN